ncbi:MAG: prephenate dehydrogenase/arogenate dehydrogenase family protein [Actinomycetota bacterium]
MVDTSLGRVALIGTGLLGGSLGLALKASRRASLVVGYDADDAALRAALAGGAIDEPARSGRDAAAGASLVVLAVPVDLVSSVSAGLGDALEPDATVTDVGSTKSEVVVEGERWFGPRFVGGHPMAGSERHGIEAADAFLFEDAWWILTPTERTSAAAYARVVGLAQAVGARPVAVDPQAHDALMARLSHVPQLTASALVTTTVAAADRASLLGLAAGGFRDVTRIAASNPALWVPIIRSNRSAVLDALEKLGAQLGWLAEMIRGDRWGELADFLSRARAARLELFARGDLPGEPVALSMLVPDRPGVLAEVTTAAGELGANIEDLRIVHSTEGGRGRLELIVAGPDAAESLTAALAQRGYRAERTRVD